ncbi:hypothetical protein [uncultured Ramlibacter sp.]|uniref:hypothetical protein n=1 Tax=uncultured Ramlibacter sp. TaxID=260755 RepID=UPI0026152B3C|nr:hypothetical protein [uncultured Ramlibacter sp.]
MHQSPEKHPVSRRDKYAGLDASDAEAERRSYRASQPKARKFLRRDEEAPREQRQNRQPRG